MCQQIGYPTSASVFFIDAIALLPVTTISRPLRRQHCPDFVCEDIVLLTRADCIGYSRPADPPGASFGGGSGPAGCREGPRSAPSGLSCDGWIAVFNGTPDDSPLRDHGSLLPFLPVRSAHQNRRHHNRLSPWPILPHSS
jgi:hypothetical protein